jgi:heptosyltransferase II
MPNYGGFNNQMKQQVWKILIHSPNWLGDVIMAMPAITKFAELNPEYEITVLAKKAVKTLWEFHEVPKKIILYQEGNGGLKKTSAELKNERFDEAILLPRTFRSALVTWLAGIPVRRGYVKDFRRLLLTHPVKKLDHLEPKHQLYEYAYLLGVTISDPLTRPNYGFKAPEGTLTQDIKKLFGDNDIVALMPGAKRGTSKQWPQENYIEVAKKLLQTDPNLQILVLGDQSEVTLCENIANQIKHPKALSLAGKTSFPQWIEIISLSRLVICNDSGGMHVAAALNTPLIAIFGITDPQKTGPLSNNAVVLQDSEIRSRSVPRESELANSALKRITPEKVLEMIKLQ